MSVEGNIGRQLAPRISDLAPGLTSSFVREALHRAITGVGPLPPAAAAADKQLREQRGNVEDAIREVIENHVRYAGAQALHRAITGVGPLPPAAAAADKQLREQRGNVEDAIREVIENHVRYAGAQGL